MAPKASTPRPNVLSANCPTRAVLDLIADKWTALVIHVLADGTHRFGELQRTIDGISQKMLTQTLRRLEHDGLVQRTVYPEVPPRTEYALTSLGKTLREPLQSLCAWAEKHLPTIATARSRRTKHD